MLLSRFEQLFLAEVLTASFEDDETYKREHFPHLRRNLRAPNGSHGA